MHETRYTDGVAEIVVWVPWDEGAGLIPPPRIDFYVSLTNRYRSFIYAGSADAPEQD